MKDAKTGLPEDNLFPFVVPTGHVYYVPAATYEEACAFLGVDPSRVKAGVITWENKA